VQVGNRLKKQKSNLLGWNGGMWNGGMECSLNDRIFMKTVDTIGEKEEMHSVNTYKV
jgi:hypothetical protein